MPGEKKTILLDYKGTIDLLMRKLMAVAAEHFRLTLPKGVFEQIDNSLSWYNELQALCKNKKIMVDDSGYQPLEKKVHKLIHNVCEIMGAYYDRKGKEFDYVLVGTYPTGGMEELAKLMREKGGVVISPYELALLLYHEGKLDSKGINRLRELL